MYGQQNRAVKNHFKSRRHLELSWSSVCLEYLHSLDTCSNLSNSLIVLEWPALDAVWNWSLLLLAKETNRYWTKSLGEHWLPHDPSILHEKLKVSALIPDELQIIFYPLPWGQHARLQGAPCHKSKWLIKKYLECLFSSLAGGKYLKSTHFVAAEGCAKRRTETLFAFLWQVGACNTRKWEKLVCNETQKLTWA